jgi:DNA-binding CsgD family transcriptional regulator
VETHRVNVMKKLKASNTAELIKLAAFYKLIEP